MAISLDPVLLEVLACPAEHHAPLVAGTPDDPQAAALTCTECGRMFPVRDGIPVLLLDDAVLPEASAGSGAGESGDGSTGPTHPAEDSAAGRGDSAQV